MSVKFINTNEVVGHDFNDICNFISLSIPTIVPDKSKWYTIKAHGTYRLCISKPDAFDYYGDVVARITLYKQKHILCDYLITSDTNLDKLCAKLTTKIKEARYL